MLNSYDAINNRVILVTPYKISNAEMEPEKRVYQLLILQLPEFKVVKQYVLNRELGYPPSILVTSDGENVLMHYKEYEGEGKDKVVKSTLEFYDSESMEKVDEIIETASAQDVGSLKVCLNNAFGLEAEFQANDRIISDGKLRSTLVDINERYFKRYPIISYEEFMGNYLTGAQREHLKQYEILYPRLGKSFPKIIRIGQYESSVFSIGHANKSPKATLIISDRNTMQSIFFDIDYLPEQARVYLTPDGKYIIVESFEYKEKNDGYGNLKKQEYRTGEILIFSTKNGRLINKISDSTSRGFGVRDICTLKDDQSTTLYQIKDKIYMLKAVEGGSLREIPGLSGVNVGALRCL